MKQLVLIGSGHGEVMALPILVRKILKEKKVQSSLVVDDKVIRTSDAAALVRWDKKAGKVDYHEWTRRIEMAQRRRPLGGILAVFDGDARTFPAGSSTPFCARNAASDLAKAAVHVGAGKTFSLAVVFACVEYETWIIAGAESLIGQTLGGNRSALPRGTEPPSGDPESHGKRWLEKNFPGYRPTRDQAALTEAVDLGVVRKKKLRSFVRLEHALDQLLDSAQSNSFIVTPG